MRGISNNGELYAASPRSQCQIHHSSFTDFNYVLIWIFNWERKMITENKRYLMIEKTGLSIFMIFSVCFLLISIGFCMFNLPKELKSGYMNNVVAIREEMIEKMSKFEKLQDNRASEYVKKNDIMPSAFKGKK